MQRKIPLEEILDVVSRYPGRGASLEEIKIGLESAVPYRTLQRWVLLLVKEGRLESLGKTKGKRYLLPQTKSEGGGEALIPLSHAGKAVQHLVIQPIQKRKPVGYNKLFLESYMPNSTFYLPEKLRQKLLLMGRVENDKYPAGTYAKHIFHRLLIDLSWNSSRLEGNTYSLLETAKLLDLGKSPEGKSLKETQMILNHKAAIEFLMQSAEGVGVDRYMILNLHTLLSDNLLSDSSFCGRLRLFPVGIEKSVYLPLAIPQVIEECFDLLIAKAKKIKDPFEQAFFLMVHIPYLQAFDDVNKRTSRLAANIPLIKNNLSPLSFIDVPEDTYIEGLLGIYEFNRLELFRDVFEWAYERSCALYSVTRKTLGEPDAMRLQYREAIKELIHEIVSNRMNQAQAIKLIRKITLKKVKAEDQKRFIEIIEQELLSLHEGNIARYQLRPEEFNAWKNS